jgi:hypothetical protein
VPHPLDHRCPAGTGRAVGEPVPPDWPSVAGWRREHGGLHPGAAIQGALAARFEPLLKVRRPYLARMLARHDLEAQEQALIDMQVLPALGFWMIAGRARVT